MTLRNALLFLCALAGLSALAWGAQQQAPRLSSDGSLTSPAIASAPVAPAPAAEPVRRTPVSRTQARTSAVTTVDPAWAARTASAAGIPQTAVAAYGRAVLRMPDSCGLGWTTLAGIGWVESQHGTLGGRTLGADGYSSTRILGPALDGRGAVAAIRATPGSAAFHGDDQWDHAVGPLQFIPSTWERWGSDGDGDGLSDPNDIDDAAYAAARYLCADGYDLTTGAGWNAAVISYNHAQSYVDSVYAAASFYAERAAG